MKMNEVLIYADIIDSEGVIRNNIKPWEEILQPALMQLNQQYQSCFIIPFEIVAGDAFGAVVDNLNNAISIILSIQAILSPIGVRIALVDKTIQYGIETKHFNQLQGSALWIANDSINKLKKNKMLFSACLVDERLSEILESLINLIFSIRRRWNEKTWAVSDLLQQGKTQQEIAIQLGTSQQNISRISAKNDLYLIKECEQKIFKVFEL